MIITSSLTALLLTIFTTTPSQAGWLPSLLCSERIRNCRASFGDYVSSDSEGRRCNFMSLTTPDTYESIPRCLGSKDNSRPGICDQSEIETMTTYACDAFGNTYDNTGPRNISQKCLTSLEHCRIPNVRYMKICEVFSFNQAFDGGLFDEHKECSKDLVTKNSDCTPYEADLAEFRFCGLAAWLPSETCQSRMDICFRQSGVPEDLLRGNKRCDLLDFNRGSMDLKHCLRLGCSELEYQELRAQAGCSKAGNTANQVYEFTNSAEPTEIGWLPSVLCSERIRSCRASFGDYVSSDSAGRRCNFMSAITPCLGSKDNSRPGICDQSEIETLTTYACDAFGNNYDDTGPPRNISQKCMTTLDDCQISNVIGMKICEVFSFNQFFNGKHFDEHKQCSKDIVTNKFGCTPYEANLVQFRYCGLAGWLPSETCQSRMDICFSQPGVPQDLLKDNKRCDLLDFNSGGVDLEHCLRLGCYELEYQELRVQAGCSNPGNKATRWKEFPNAVAPTEAGWQPSVLCSERIRSCRASFGDYVSSDSPGERCNFMRAITPDTHEPIPRCLGSKDNSRPGICEESEIQTLTTYACDSFGNSYDDTGPKNISEKCMTTLDDCQISNVAGMKVCEVFSFNQFLDGKFFDQHKQCSKDIVTNKFGCTPYEANLVQFRYCGLADWLPSLTCQSRMDICFREPGVPEDLLKDNKKCDLLDFNRGNVDLEHCLRLGCSELEYQELRVQAGCSNPGNKATRWKEFPNAVAPTEAGWVPSVLCSERIRSCRASFGDYVSSDSAGERCYFMRAITPDTHEPIPRCLGSKDNVRPGICDQSEIATMTTYACDAFGNSYDDTGPKNISQKCMTTLDDCQISNVAGMKVCEVFSFNQFLDGKFFDEHKQCSKDIVTNKFGCTPYEANLVQFRYCGLAGWLPSETCQSRMDICFSQPGVPQDLLKDNKRCDLLDFNQGGVDLEHCLRLGCSELEYQELRVQAGCSQPGNKATRWKEFPNAVAPTEAGWQPSVLCSERIRNCRASFGDYVSSDSAGRRCKFMSLITLDTYESIPRCLGSKDNSRPGICEQSEIETLTKYACDAFGNSYDDTGPRNISEKCLTTLDGCQIPNVIGMKICEVFIFNQFFDGDLFDKHKQCSKDIVTNKFGCTTYEANLVQFRYCGLADWLPSESCQSRMDICFRQSGVPQDLVRENKRCGLLDFNQGGVNMQDCLRSSCSELEYQELRAQALCPGATLGNRSRNGAFQTVIALPCMFVVVCAILNAILFM